MTTRTQLLKLFMLFCSVLSGALFAIVWHRYEQAVLKMSSIHSPINKNLFSNKGNNFLDALDDRLRSVSYENWLSSLQYTSVKIAHEELSYGINTFETEAQYLYGQCRILCLVLTTSRTRAKALNQTWTKHCNDAVFYGKYTETKIPVVKMEVDGESIYSSKTFCKIIVDLIGRMQNFDWMMITTDKTYAIIENLRYYVAPLNPEDRFYIGRPVHHYFLGVYNSYDSGIIMSRGTVNLLANSAFSSLESCSAINKNGIIYSNTFDAYLGMLLTKHNIKPANSLDNRTGHPGGSRFHPFMPEKHITPALISLFDSYWTSNVLPATSGINCCSKSAITFTGFSPVTMYFIEYVLYHLGAFGVNDGAKGLGNKQPSYESYRVAAEIDTNSHRRKKHSKKKKKKKSFSKKNDFRDELNKLLNDNPLLEQQIQLLIYQSHDKSA